MSKNRNLMLARYGGFYEFQDFGDRMKCCYCGDIREAIDHIPALSVVDGVGMKEIRKRKIKLITVPSCWSCNSRLHDKPLATYSERLVYLYNDLQNKLDKSVLWSKEDLDELGGNLKKMVVAKQLQIRRELLLRLRGMEARMASVYINDEELK